MIRFALRLSLRGGREAAVRLAITAAAVALGVGFLLATLAASHGVNAQNARYAWLNSGVPEVTTGAPSPDPLWARLSSDLYRDRRIIRVDVATTGPRSPVPPGIPRLPGPGEYYTSPAMAELLGSAPFAELGERYPGSRIGTVGDAALPAPDSLIIVVGRTAEELSRAPDAAAITSIATGSPGNCGPCRAGISATGMRLILSITAAALLLPVLLFIGTATRLSAARREQRFAAMRLVGATPRQVSVIAAVEAALAAGAGTAAGFALFMAFRIPMAAIPFTGERFFPADLSLRPAESALVAAGVPLAAMAAARIALRRVRISPLGVSRRVTPRPPRAYRVLPLLGGLAELTYFVGRRPETTNGQTLAYLSGILLTMAGLVIAGPWLTMAGARALSRRAVRPAALIAGRRLGDDPRAGFRAISGLALALFVTSAAVGVITTMNAERNTPAGTAMQMTTVVTDAGGSGPRPPTGLRAQIPALAGLRSIRGVRGHAVIRVNPAPARRPVADIDPLLTGVISCADLAFLQELGHCAPGARTAEFVDSPAAYLVDDPVWPVSALSPEALRALPILGVAVRTDGSEHTVEQVKTLLTAALPALRPPATIAEHHAAAEDARLMDSYRRLANVVVLVSLCVAGCGLAVSVIGGLNDRRRPFGLLRLTGVRIGVLRRVVLLESAVPLLLTAAAAVGAGFLAAHLFLRSQMDYNLHPPGASYYLTVAAGLAASLGIIAATFPLLRRITDPAAVRTE